MLFNSIEFAIFFPIVFILYWTLFKNTIKYRNIFILITSYFFYGMWDWRFLSLIAISSYIDYFIGIKIYKEQIISKRKIFLAISVAANLGLLGFFKYFNFFADSFVTMFTMFGQEFSYQRMNIILPVGISFYTFQTMSYSLDIYQKKLEPSKDIVSFFAFVSFFPQLVAGPIERAKNLLPQFYTVKKAEYSALRSGLLIIAVGLFKKIVIADRLAVFVDSTFENIDAAAGLPLILSVVFFAFQLYLDFSAYSDIAIGLAKTLGFNLSTNFKRPYLSVSFSDFWKRWHITLSSWFKDYLYIPLGGSKLSKSKTIRNVLIVFVLSGLWHGASWNFVIWGTLNGLFLIFFDGILNKIKYFKIINYLIVFSFWTLSLIFFRAETYTDAINFFSKLGTYNSASLFSFGLNEFEFKMACILIFITMLFEFISEKRTDLIEWVLARTALVRYAVYFIICFIILLFGSYGVELNDQNFIYFQF